MLNYPWLFSYLETTWLRQPNFFPNRDQALEEKDSICIGTKSRNLGDALVTTTLVQGLKIRNPGIRIYTFPRGFNPVVFYGNPQVEEVSFFPRSVFGDDCNWGEGHLIHQKEKYFDLPLSNPARPVIHLLPEEKSWAGQYLQSLFDLGKSKPLCVLHTSGATWRNLLPTDFWESLIQRWSETFVFLQLGVIGDTPVAGAKTLFVSKSVWNARKVFAIMQKASGFIGVDSGPMHVAQAFAVPSLVFIQGADPASIFENRTRYPYFLHNNRTYCNLYEKSLHLRVDGANEDEFVSSCHRFLKSIS